jgi:hypothetical protein
MQSRARLNQRLNSFGRRLGGLTFAVLCLTACSTVPPINKPSADIYSPKCQSILARLEFHIHKADVRDAQYAVIDGLPLFRVDRLLQERKAAATSIAKRQQWWQRAAEHGVSSYLVEFANLPAQRQAKLPAAAELEKQLQACADAATNQLLSDSAWQYWAARAVVPSEYFAGRRALGLYPLTNMAMRAGIADWQAQTRQLYNQALEESANYVLWRPEANAMPVAGVAYHEIAYDELDLPTPTDEQWQRLAAAFAPQWALPLGTDYDEPGRPLADGGFEPAPLVYWQASVGKVHGKFLPQISYVMWFSERPPAGALDILAGKLDGVVWRVTLSPTANGDWQPLIYDSIHACGCYHLFFPTPGLAHCAVDNERESAFVPQAAPETPFALWLQSASHYLQGLKPAPKDASVRHYQLVALDELRVPAVTANEQRPRLYNSRGLVSSSQRLERFLLWTSGLVSPGAMRQWGNHATAFSGERYFDEPALFDKEFCPVNPE